MSKITLKKAEEDRVMTAMEALQDVTSMTEYHAAKKLAARCTPRNQLALVDSLIAARKRAMGVAQ